LADLAPLKGLTSLQTLSCSHTQVSDLAPLKGLTSLQTLYCSSTQVSDLAPLKDLPVLKKLNCSQCRFAPVCSNFWFKPSLESLILYETDIPGIPSEVLSQDRFGDNCLDRLRTHLRDLAAGSEDVQDFKLMVLGNGRVGKTQICRKLRGEEYDASVESTHGISVTSALIPNLDSPEPGRLQIWDFGGQDIYHGTHALFMRSRAIFLIVWTPAFENTGEHAHGGFTFRNQPLPYWLDYVRQFGGDDSPIIIVQARCDTWKEEKLRPPVLDETLGKFRLPPRVVRYSALTDYGRAGLDEALQQAAAYLKEQHGTAVIGTGRARVKRRIEALRDADAALPRDERQHRTLSHATFVKFCDEAGGIEQPEHLLSYLHNVGTVFHRPGLFDNRIILDQSWALEAIYAVFHREKCFKRIERQHGRFTGSDLAEWIWNEGGYGEKEQELFLSMMQACGICFTHRRASPDKRIEAEYIAPDLLPLRSETDVDQKWDADRPAETAEFTYALLPPSLMRGIISHIGDEAGLAGDYWRYGVYLYEGRSGSRATIEQYMDAGWQGRIRIQTQRGEAAALVARLVALVEQQQQFLGVVPISVTGIQARAGQELEARGAVEKGLPPRAGVENKLSDRTEREPAPLAVEQEPAARPEYYVSYAWKDKTPEGHDREAIVDSLCEAAHAKGISILRDKNVLGVGGRISKFMNRIGRGGRVFVVLSDKYLKSPYCMYELHEVWRNCRHEDREFLKRIRVFTLPDAKIWTPIDRAKCAAHWKKESAELEAIVKEHGYDVLGEEDFKRYRLMKEFAHQIGNILATVTDILQPRNFEELEKYGFGEPGSKDD
jgi:internalin A